MQTIEEFLQYYSNDKVPLDPAESMSIALVKRQKALVDARIKLIQYLTPVRSKSGWTVTLANDAGGAVEDLAGEIEVAEGLVYEVQSDIKTFLGTTGGKPRLAELADELRRARSKLAAAQDSYRRIVAVRLQKGTALSDVHTLEDVQQAETKALMVEEEVGPVVSDLEGRLRSANAILGKYR